MFPGSDLQMNLPHGGHINKGQWIHLKTDKP